MNADSSKLGVVVAKAVAGHTPVFLGEFNITDLLTFCKDNKVPLLALNNRCASQALHESDQFKKALQEDEEMLSSFRGEYVLVQARWAAAGIRCILIKSGGVFPSFPYTSDNLDVLVKEEHEGTARSILRNLGYIELKNIEEPRKFLFRKFREGICVSAIHLHTQVGWDVSFMDENYLWDNCRASPDDASVVIPSPEDIILITIAHAFYENKRFRLDDVVKVRECWREGKIDWKYVETAADQGGWLEGLCFSVLLCDHLEDTLWQQTSVPTYVLASCRRSLKHSRLTWRYYKKLTLRNPVALPFKISFIFSKYLYYKKVLSDKRYSLGRRFWDLFRTLLYGIRLKSGIRPQPSLLVSFSGPDGSGKTQHSRVLAEALATCGLSAKHYWSRCANSFLIRFAATQTRRLFGGSLGKISGTPGPSGRAQRLRNPILRFIWTYTVAAEMILSYFFHVWLPLRWGKIVICDRYTFDAAAEIESSLYPNDRLNRMAIKLMLILAPKPQFAYFLDLPEEICAQRKDEDTDLLYLRRQRQAYEELLNHYHLRRKATNREFSDTADEILCEILVPYYEHFETFLNGLFLANPSQLNRHNRGGGK